MTILKTDIMSKERLRVKVTKSSGWYKVGEIHEVGNYITLGYGQQNLPYFEKEERKYGISLSNCIVLGYVEEAVEYTMEELEEKLGHPVKIKSNDKD